MWPWWRQERERRRSVDAMVDADRDMARRREVEEPGAAVAWTAVTI